jgi:hypothetical protein
VDEVFSPALAAGKNSGIQKNEEAASRHGLAGPAHRTTSEHNEEGVNPQATGIASEHSSIRMAPARWQRELRKNQERKIGSLGNVYTL